MSTMATAAKIAPSLQLEEYMRSLRKMASPKMMLLGNVGGVPTKAQKMSLTPNSWAKITCRFILSAFPPQS